MHLDSKEKKIKIFENISSIDLYPVQFGAEACSSTHSVPFSKFRNYILHYIVSGSGYIHIEEYGYEVKLSTGQGFLIAPDMISSSRSDVKDTWKYYWIEFNGIKAKKYITQGGLGERQQIYQVINQDAHGEIIVAFDKLLTNTSQSETAILGLTYILLNQLIHASSKVSSWEENSGKNFYIREAVKFINENYNKGIIIEDIANHCNLNRAYLTKLFKEELGITPSKFLTKVKLSYGCDLLEQTNLSIKEISEELGYANQFVFSSTFKKNFNISPTKWRNQK